MARLETPEDTAKYYEENIHQGIDPNDPDAEKTFADVTAALGRRQTDYMQMFSDAAGEIAKMPSDFVEGVMDDPNPIKLAYSTAEGTARGIRDMYGMFLQSENPTSPLFKFKGLIRAIMNGKPSQNWREELDQWNEARRFNYHSYKMMEGDETLLEQFDSLNMSDERKEQFRSLVNPRVAHAMSFIGMELPSIIAAPFTGGASAELGVVAAASRASKAASVGLIRQIGGKMAAAEQRFSNMAARASQRIAGHAISGAGSALEPVANLAEGLLGGSVQAVANKTGMSSSAARNAVEMSIVNSTEAIGASGIKQTVGFIGSMGLRTTSEVLRELGDTILQRSSGAIPIKDINGLTVLERLALRKDLSPTAKLVAKTANVLVDPMLQLSTSALNNSYKDALIFGGLGYLNDRERGMVGGAAMGMVWGGYSGAFRHTWSNVSGALSHQMLINNFDQTFISEVEKSNTGFASTARSVIAEVDAFKSSKISANVRSTIKNTWLMLTPYERANAIFHRGTKEELVNKLVNAGLDARKYLTTDKDGNTVVADSGENASFSVVRSLTPNKDLVPVIFLDSKRYRALEIGHETMSHAALWSLTVKGRYGEFFKQLVGTEKEGGLVADELLIVRAAKTMTAEHYAGKVGIYMEGFKASGGNPADSVAFAKYINEDRAGIYQGNVKLITNALTSFRNEAKQMGDAFWNASVKVGNDTVPAWKAKTGDSGDLVSKYIFEEPLAGTAESLFTHTNVDEITMPDADKPFRYVMERWRNELFAKKVTDMELAGIHASTGIFTENASKVTGDPAGQVSHQAMVYDDGKYYRQPELESFLRSVLKAATNEDGQAVAKLSPERQAIEAKRYKKEWMFKFTGSGAVMHGNKKLNEDMTERAAGAMSVLEQLPENFRPEIIVDEHGNKTIDMYKMKDEAFDALIAANVIDKVSADTAKGFRDTMTRWEASGFAEGNVMSATYWGDSHRTIKRGLFERIFGKEVPITHRVFVPFELKLSVRTTDSEGKPLRAPKGGMVATVVDYMAIHRRKMKNWARPEFRRQFMSLDQFNSDFDLYLTNMMKDPATRVPTAELFRAKYGNEAESVRDMLYETFGGRKRMDEGFINTPKDSYRSNPEDPNYPIHSMKLDMIVGAERMPVSPFPYHHGRSYEGLRRNFSAGGFEIYDGKGNRLRNGQGYEVLVSGKKYKAFDPFGGLIGIYDTAKKAIKATKKHFGNMDEADIMPEGIDPALLPERSATNTPSLRNQNYVDTISADWTNGVRYSISGLDFEGNLTTYVPDFKDDVFGMLENSMEAMWQTKDASGTLQWTGKKNQMGSLTIGDFVNNVNDLVTFRNKTDILGEFRVEQIRVMPSPPSGRDFSLIGVDGKKGSKAEVRRVSTEIDGRPYSLTKLPNTSSPVLLIDTKRIAELAGTDKDSRNWQTQQILKKAISEISLSYGPHADLFGFGITPIGAFGAEQLMSMSGIVKYIRRKLSNSEVANLAEENMAISEMRTRILDKNATHKVDDNLTSNGSGMLVVEPASKLSTAKTSVEIAKAVGVEPSLVGKFNKRSTEMLRSIAVSFSKVNKEMESAEFAMVPSRQGEIAAPVVESKNMLMYATEATNALNRAIKDDNANGNAYMLFANQMNHYLAQVHSGDAFLDAAQASGTTGMLSVPFQGTRVNAAPSRAVAPNFTLRSGNKALKNPAVFFFGKMNQGRESGVTGMSGFTFIVDADAVSANSLGGVLGSTEAMQMNLGKNTSPRLTDRSLQLGVFDSVTLNRAFGNLLTDGEVKRGNHIEMLTAAALMHMPDREKEIMALHQNYRNDGKGLNYADQILGMSIADKKGAVYDLAHAVYDVEFNYGPEGEKTALAWARDDATSPEYAEGLRYVKDASKTNFNHAMQQYFSIPSGKTTKFGEEAKTLYGRRAAAEMGIVPSIEAYEKFSKKASELHTEMASQYSKRLSIGSLDVVGDSDVRERIYRSRLARKTFINGSQAFVFEFSDSKASFNLAKARGQLSLLPFINELDPDKGLSDYKAAVIRLSANKGISRYIPESVILGTAKVGDIFRHDELFEYYPKLRNMDIEFKDFHGARFVRYGNKGKIEVGVRSMVGNELNLPPSAGGVRMGSNESLADIFASKNPIAGMVLHELQHAIQQEHGWIDNNEIGFLPAKVATHYLANLLGLKTNFSLKADLSKYFSDPIITAESGKFLPVDAMKQAAKDEAELHRRLLNAVDSPVYKSLKANAKPLMVTAARNFADFVMAEHRRGGVDDAVARTAQEILDKSKMANDLDSIIDAYVQMDELSQTLAKSNDEYISGMIANIDFRSAKAAIGMVTTISLLDQSSPMDASVLVGSILRNYREMSYLSEPVEAMAFETQKRAGLGEEQLQSSKRQYTFSEDMRADSTLGIIKAAFESSDVITDRGLGGMIRGGGVITSIMKSIGGLGEISDADSPMVTSMGKAVLTEVIAHRAQDIIDGLKRVMLVQRGWSVDKDGKPVLMSGKYLLKGATYDEFVGRMEAQFGKGKLRETDGSVLIDSTQMSEKGHAYTIEDLALLSSTVIESRNAISVGNSAIDAVLSPAFPDFIDGGNLAAELHKIGTATDDGITYANVEKLSRVFTGVKLTKNDIVNLMAYNHRSLHESTAIVGQRSNPYGASLVPNFEGVNREKKLALLSTTKGASVLNQVTGLNDNGFTVDSSGVRFTFGKFKAGGYKIKFTANETPRWIAELGQEAVEAYKVTAQRIANAVSETMQTSFAVASSEVRDTAYEIANKMNRRLIAKMRLIEPLVDRAVEMLKEKDVLSVRERAELAVSLMSEIEKAHYIMVASDIDEVRSDNYGEHRDFVIRRGSTLQTTDTVHSRALKRLGVGEGPFALGGHTQSAYNFSQKERINPLMMVTAFNPFVVSGEHTYGHGTSTVYDVNHALAGGFINETSGVLRDTRSTLPEDNPKAYEVRTQQLLRSPDIRATHDNLLNAINSIKEHNSETAAYNENILRDISNVEANGDSAEFQSSGEMYMKIQEMSPEERAVFRHQVEKRIEQMGRDQAIISRLIDSAADFTDNRRSEPNRYLSPDRPNMMDYESKYTPLNGLQAYSLKDSAIIELDTFAPSASASESWSNAGNVLSMVPPEVRKRYVSHMAYIDHAVQTSLFANVSRLDSVEETMSVEKPFERLAPFFKVAKEIARNANEATFESLSGQAISHMVGGNVIISMGLAARGALDNNMSVTEYVRMNESIFRRLWAEDGVYAKPAISRDAGLVVNNEVNGVNVSHASIGVSCMVPMVAMLNNGFMDFWKDSKTLTLDIPDAFKSLEYETLTKQSMEQGLSASRMDAIKETIGRFMDKLTDEDIDRLTNELSSTQNAETVVNMLAYINSRDLADEQIANPDRFQHAPPAVSLSEGISLSLHTNAQHVVSGHAAITKTDVGLGAEEIKEYRKFIKSSLKEPKFWHGFFASMPAMKDIIGSFPSTRTAMDHPFYSRTTPDSVRGRADFRYTGGKMARFSKEMGHPVDSHTAMTAHGAWSGQRMSLAETNFTKFPNGVSVQPLPLIDVVSPELVGSMFTQANALSQFGSFANRFLAPNVPEHGRFVPKTLARFHEQSGEYLKIEKDPQVATGSIKVNALRKGYSDSINRRLIVNQIANMAANLGKENVSIQPARFPSSSRPYWQMYGTSTASARAELINSPHGLIEKYLQHGTSNLENYAMHSGSHGRMGFSWQRLEDGRIMVNYSPSIDIHATHDLSLGTIETRTQLGINLRRAIGYDHGKGGLLIPQAQTRMLGIIRGLSNLRDGTSNSAKRAALDSVARRAATNLPVDAQYMKHLNIAASRALRNGGHGELLSKLVEDLNTAKEFGNVHKPHALIRSLLNGEPYNEALGGRDLANHITHVSSILAQANPEFGYLTFVLPKDATIEDFKTAVVNSMLSTGNRIDNQGSGTIASMSSNFHVGRNSPYMSKEWIDPDVIYNALLKRNDYDVGTTKLASVDNNVNSWTPNNAGFGEGHELMSNAVAEVLRRHSQANVRFIDQIERTFSMMSSQDVGYHIPDSERALANNGDRAVVIRNMFPNRPDLLHYAWDNESSINLAIVKPSNRGGTWKVGHDVITGLDASGIPQKRRVVRSFNTESEANAYAGLQSGRSVNAEIPKALFGENGFKIQKVAGKTNVEANVHEGLQVNAEAFASDGGERSPDFVRNGKFFVGDFPVEFASKEEAGNFARMLLTSELIQGEAPKNETLRLSSGGLTAKDMEQELRKQISFSSEGSPYQFSSTLMRMIADGVVNKVEMKNGRQVKTSTLASSATGAEWYESLVAQRVGKMEMRVTGLVQFLYDHKDVQISREELAQFAYAMYPRMGRVSYYRNEHTAIPQGRIGIRGDVNPVASAYNNSLIYSNYVGKQMETLTDAINTASDESKPSVVAAVDAVRNAHLNSFRQAVDMMYGKGTGEKMVPNADAMMALMSESTKNPQINASLLEIYRLTYNDAYSKIQAETLSALNGRDLRVIDFNTAFGSAFRRPKYLQMPEAHLSSAELKGDFRIANTDEDYKGWSSGAGPYQMDTIHGEIAANAERFLEFKKLIEEKIRTAPTQEAKDNYTSMLSSATRIQEVRTRAAEQHTVGYIHKASRKGAVQFAHLRYSNGAVMKHAWPNSDLTHLYDQIALTSDDAMPVTFIEELQSDTYQKADFGPKLEAGLALPSDMKQAASFSKINELKSIDARIRALNLSLSDKTYLARNFNLNNIQGMATRLYRGKQMGQQFERMSVVERYIAYKMVESHDSIGDGVVINQEKPLKISKRLSDRFGVPRDVPRVEFKDEASRRRFMLQLGASVQEAPKDSSGEYMHTSLVKLYAPFGVDADSYEIPNLPKINANHMLNGGRIKSLTGSIYSMSAMIAAHDEAFVSKAIEIAARGDTLLEHGFDFDDLAARAIDEIGKKSEMHKERLSIEERRYFSSITDDMRELLAAGVDGLEHGYLDNVHRENKSMVYNDLNAQYGPDFREFAIMNRKALFLVPSESNAGLADIRGQTVRAMTIPNALMHDARLILQNDPEQAAEIRKKAIGEQNNSHMTLRASQHYSKMFDFIEGKSDGSDMNFGFWDNAINDIDMMMNVFTADTQMAEGYSDPKNAYLAAYPHTAKTALGRIFEITGHHIASSISSLAGNTELPELMAKREELAKQMGVPAEQVDYRYPDIYPLGEDNAYRAASVNFYVMRGLQMNKRGMTFADARHHRERYSATGSIGHSVSLGKGLTMPLRGTHADFTLPYWIELAKNNKGNADFINRLLTEGIGNMADNNGAITHNGSTMSLAGHMSAAIVEGMTDVADVLESGIIENVKSSAMSTFTNIEHPTTGRNLQSIIADAKRGYAIDLRMLEQMTNGMGDGNDVLKRIHKMLDKPVSVIQSVPVSRTHGYAANYGAPHWQNLVYYAGLPMEQIARQSHDLFERPVVEMKDGKYNIVDAKTGRLLLGGIESKEEMYEKVAQLSKYLGGTPLITNFLKQYNRTGAHVLDSFMWTGGGLDGVGFRTPESIKNEFVQMLQASGVVQGGKEINLNEGGMREIFTDKSTQLSVKPDDLYKGNNWANRTAKFGFSDKEYGNSNNWDVVSVAAYAHAMGVRKGSSTMDVTAALTKMTGFTSPVMVFKPKFITEAQSLEMRKMIADGIPFMSVGGLQDYNAKVNEGIKTYKFFRSDIRGAKQNDER